MAVIPKKFSPQKGSYEERIAEMERYIKYLEEQIEHYASAVNKKIGEIEKNTGGKLRESDNPSNR